MAKMMEEQWLSAEQVAVVLGVPWPTVHHWARAGDPRLPAYKVWDDAAGKQGRYRFKKADVEAFQAETQQDPKAPRIAEL
jgi:excisionase family DNA binding protein